MGFFPRQHMRGQMKNFFKLGKNGSELPAAHALALDGRCFQTPKEEVAGGTSAGASSLSDEQNRRPNIGAFATLRENGLVRDTHFNLGGASGRTDKAGDADPIATHVYLETSESDETAQEMLNRSEKTCFLHAFCKTDLKTKLKVVRI